MPAANINQISATPLIRFLDENGDSTGNFQTANNYSGTPTRFFTQPAAGERYFIREISISLEVTGNLSAGGYGIGLALPIGIALRIRTGNQLLAVPQIPFIKTNTQLGSVVNRLSSFGFQGNTQVIKLTLELEAIGTNTIILTGTEGDYIEVTLNDDFTTRCVSQVFGVFGVQS